MLTQIAEAPCETLCVDFVGPLLRSSQGSNMLLVAFEKFSKSNNRSREQVLTRYGAPKKNHLE